jgi:AbrB family looped-hinge helix DNA binding protein
MTITMTSKNQITLPKKIVDALRLRQGSLFDINVKANHIELVPLEVSQREFTNAEYEKLEKLYQKEKGSVSRVTKTYINGIK